MASITLKDIDPSLLERLKVLAADDKRSLNRQVIWLLEQRVDPNTTDPAVNALQQQQAQLAAWQNLSGRWVGTPTETDEVIADIYQTRTEGREFSW